MKSLSRCAASVVSGQLSVVKTIAADREPPSHAHALENEGQHDNSRENRKQQAE
jgi:hypothetical protein